MGSMRYGGSAGTGHTPSSGSLENSPHDRAACARLSSRLIVSLSAQGLSHHPQFEEVPLSNGIVSSEQPGRLSAGFPTHPLKVYQDAAIMRRVPVASSPALPWSVRRSAPAGPSHP